MSATFTFKMREALATRLAKAATVTGLEPCDLARIAIANLVAGIEQHGRLLPATPLPPLGRHEIVLVEQAPKAGNRDAEVSAGSILPVRRG